MLITMQEKHTNIRLAVAAIAITALSVAGYAYLGMSPKEITPKLVSTSTEEYIPKQKYALNDFDPRIKGAIMFSGLPKTLSGKAIPLAFTHILDSHELRTTGIMMSHVLDVFPSYMSYSSNKHYVAYVGTKKDVNAKDRVAIYRTLGSGSLDGLHPDMLVAASDTIVAPRLPVINTKGEVAYMALPSKDTNTTLDATNWVIHLATDEGDRVVARGLYPHFAGVDSIIYLAKDGVRMQNIRTGDVSLVVSYDNISNGSSLTANTMLGVSSDGSMFAVSQPDQLIVSVFKFSGKGAVKTGEIRTQSFWPVFSPDGSILGLQSVRDIATIGSSDADAMVTFYDLTREGYPSMTGVMDLTGNDPNQLFITDWK